MTVTIGGREYPCRPTMGAMLRFKRETGREVTEMDAASMSDLCVYLWCCVASASAREGVEFSLPLMEFADALDPEDLSEWTASMEGDAQGDGQKKRTPGKSSRES